MPKFGIRKIGGAAFKVAQLREQSAKKFGPRKFGARKAAAMNAALEAAEAEATGDQNDHITPPAAPITATSIKQVDEALKENPVLYEELYTLELERAEGPRKGALRIFLAAEMNLEGGPRDERLGQIEGLLKPKA